METELKFDIDVAAAARLRDDFVLADGGGSEQLLRSVYFDTPAFDLRAAGVALRVRQADGRCVQTIKNAGRGLFGRGEWESDVAGLAFDLDAGAGTPLEGALSTTDRDKLQPVFEVRVDRATREVAVGGAMVEVALDRGSVSADGRDTPICELELELKDGGIADLFDLARSLAGRADLNLAFTSKAERGYALVERKALDACPAKRPRLDPKGDVGEAFKAIGGGALSQVAVNARILRTVRRPEALHQLRVGLRRLRSALTLFQPMLAADDRLDQITAELKWISEETCEARDLDVFIARTFRRAAQQHHSARGLGAFGESLLAAQTRAYDRMEQAIGSARFRSLMLETAAWTEIGAWSVSDDPQAAAARDGAVRDFAAEVLGDLHRRIEKKARELESLSPRARHRLRIKAKTLRYACDFFASLYRGKAGRKHDAYADAVAALQDALGVLNDLAVSEELAARVVGADATASDGPYETVDLQRAFAAGSVAGQGRQSEAKLMKAALKARDALGRAPVFWS